MSTPDTPQVQLGCVANLFSRMMHFRKSGDVEHGHRHLFDHLTLLSKGSLRVRIGDQETVFQAPHMIYIRAQVEHELTALEDDTLAFCIHALRDGDGVGDIVDPSMVPTMTNGSVLPIVGVQLPGKAVLKPLVDLAAERRPTPHSGLLPVTDTGV